MSRNHLKVVASALGITASIAASLGRADLMMFAFVAWLISSILWAVISYEMKEISLFAMQACFTVIDIFGMWHWIKK